MSVRPSLQTNMLTSKHQWLGSDLDYQETWDFQLDHLANVLEGNEADRFFYLEHSPVYTIGRTRDQSSLRNPDSLPHPTVEVNRGGEGTYHGPGQLVGYPIIDLRPLGKDLHLYIRALEEALILTCQEFEINAHRREGLTGVWVGKRKLASIGVGVKKWIAMHGFAINITTQSLEAFSEITPCGIDNVSMTCVANETPLPVNVSTFTEALKPHLENCIYALAHPTA